MERWVPEAGIGYVWMRELGGRRRPSAGSKHVALRNDAFRAYADYMETEPSWQASTSCWHVATEETPGSDV